MSELLQHLVVGIVALLAAWVVVRRVFGVFAPAREASPGCSTCASNPAAGTRPDQGR